VTDKAMQEGTPIVEQPMQTTTKSAASATQTKTTVATVLSLYQKENQQLKEKIIQLEKKIDKLIDDKEQMLRDEMQKIEQVYSTKDEQLKTILELVNAKLMIDNSKHYVPELEVAKSNPKNSNENNPSQIIELKEYIRTLDLKSYQKKIIKKRFLAVYDSDIRIIHQNGKLYLDFSKYDYTDLLEY
jgi:TolA-binding protein